jgi:hypothetical protein
MHKIVTSIRQIAPTDLPTVTPIGEATRPMNDAELLNMGIQHLSGDYYSCIHQEERDDDTLQWAPKEGQSLPGTVVTEGFLQQRHAELPDDVKGLVMQARVIRSTTPAVSAKAAADANLAEVGTALETSVGMVAGAPLVDTTSPEAQLLEAQRMVGIPGSGLERETVPMADVMAGDVVEAEGLIPHSWAGEPRR